MAAILMLGDVKVAEWTGAGPVPWPLNFTPDGATASGADIAALGWPTESMAGKTGTGALLLAYRGSPQAVMGLTITTPFHVWRVDRASVGGTEQPWSPAGANDSDWGAVSSSYVAALGATAPVALNWTGVARVVFGPTEIAALKAQSASASATLMNRGEAYLSGNPIFEVDDSVIITAAPEADGEGHDASTLPSSSFWKWVCAETQEEITTRQFTRSVPSADQTRTYTAFWKPNSVKVEVAAGDNGIEVVASAASGKYYSKSATGEPNMPMFYARVIEAQASDRSFQKWTKTVYTIDAITGELVAGTPVEVAVTPDAGFPDYEPVQTVRETADLVARVVYRAYSSYSHDRVAASVANTYLLKGASYTKAPTGSNRFGDDGYAGAYSLSYDQPVGVNYTVKARLAGDITPAGGVVTGSHSGTFTDSNTGKVWAASYILFAVNADGEPVGPEEEPTVPVDPDMPEIPGAGGGGGGSGSPVGTGISLQIVAEDVGVTAGAAELAIGGSTLLEVSYPDEPVAVKNATEGTVYILTVSDLAPTGVIVKSVTANGTAVIGSGNTWPISAGTGATSVVVTLGFPPLKTLLVDVVSVPSISAPDTNNAVTISPAPFIAPDRWVAGTVLTLTPVPVAGYSHVLWQRADATGASDQEGGGTPYAFQLDADTVVTAGFRKPLLDVVLTVKGSDTLADEFDWTYEESDADDTVPVEMEHSLFNGSQIGIFKVGTFAFHGVDVDSRLQTAGDAAYNKYVDMPVAGVDISYDGGVTWEDAGGEYPAEYNAQPTPADKPYPDPPAPQTDTERAGRAAARVGKHTVSRIPLNDTLHVRIRLIATVSISVGLPPVKWEGGKYDSMIGTGKNNWGCGCGVATITHTVTGATATMNYGLTHPLAILTAPQPAPYPDYFNSYPYISAELGDTVTAQCVPDTGFYFAAWIEGYFSHTWEDSGELITSEDRLVWPVGNYISTDATATVTVNEGMKKIMLKLKAVVAPRYVLFTQDAGNILAVRPGQTVPELIRPTITWTYEQDTTAAGTNVRKMRFTPATPTQSASWTGTFAALCTAWDATVEEMAALGIVLAGGSDDTVSKIWQVNRNNLVTTGVRIVFHADLPFGMSWTPWYDIAGNAFPPEYMGVYRRVHLTNAAGAHEAGPWEFVGRGVSDLTGGAYWCTYLAGLTQKFTVDVEYRVRWVPYVEPTEEAYQLTVGYEADEDMVQGIVSAEIGGASTGEINSRIRTIPDIVPTDTVVIHAVPRPGFTFVSWLLSDGETTIEEADHTVDPDTEGYVFLANFTPNIIETPENTTKFHVGFVEGNAGRGTINVRVFAVGGAYTDTAVTAQAGAEFTLATGENAYVWAVSATGWVFGGWRDASGLPRGSGAAYYPLADASPGGNALYRDVYFAEYVPPVETGNVPFRAGFANVADVPYALLTVYVNGVSAAVLNGVQHVDMLLTEGDTVSLEVVPVSTRRLTGFVNRSYEASSIPVIVRNVSVTNQGVLAVLGLVDPIVGPGPNVIPGTPATGAGLWLFDGGTVNKAFMWRSRRFETPVPTEFNSARVCRNGAFFPAAVGLRLNAYSSPEATSPNTDINIAITDEVPRKLPKIRRERYFEVEVTAQDDIECIKVGSSMGELQNG